MNVKTDDFGVPYNFPIDFFKKLTVSANSLYLLWGQFHKTIYDVFSSQKDRTMFLNQNLRFMKIKKFTKFSLFGVNLRS